MSAIEGKLDEQLVSRCAAPLHNGKLEEGEVLQSFVLDRLLSDLIKGV